MRILNVDTYYPAFLSGFYARSPGLAELRYTEQLATLLGAAFGIADFYSSNLARLGAEAADLIANCEPLQRRWLAEHPVDGAGRSERGALAEILLAQVAEFRPDVLLVQDCITLDAALVREAGRSARLVVGQIACPMPTGLDLSPYDLMLSSMPHLVRTFRAAGLRGEYFRLGFEASLVGRVGQRDRDAVTFVGGISSAHNKRRELLETLARSEPLDWWGYGVEEVAPDSPLRARHRGSAWGLEMYSVLAGSLATVNCHIDIAAPYANNMRLYEATGMGALLLTEAAENLGDQFVPGMEIETYSSPAECAEKLRYFLERPDQAGAIGEAGRIRTLAEHSYAHRMAELLEILERHL